MTIGIEPPAYRLPSATHLGAVHLHVRDLERSADYYQRVIGLQIVDRSGRDVSLAPAGTSSPLLVLHSGATTPVAARAERLGLYHFAFLLPDRIALAEFLVHLHVIGVPIAAADHAVSEALYLWDPDGLGIEVYADRPRASWQVRDGELLMTTERLDERALLATARAESWQGLPAGTTLGHMHLRVGDLPAAEDFYHRALGFDKTVWSYPGALFLSAGGYHHHLGTNTWAGPVPRRAESESGLLAWEIVIPSRNDLERAAASCAAAGYTPRPQDDRIVLEDPWGTRLELRTSNLRVQS